MSRSTVQYSTLRAGGRPWLRAKGCEPRAVAEGWRSVLVFLARGPAVGACLVGARAVRTCVRAGGAENNVWISQPCVFMQVSISQPCFFMQVSISQPCCFMQVAISQP